MDPADSDTFETIKRRVKERMNELDLNMKTISLRAGQGETYVRDMLKRDRAPSAEALKQIASVLQTTSGWLTGEDGAQEIIASEEWTKQLITVAEYEVRLSAGPGALVESENQTGVWQFSRRYLVDELRLDPQGLAIVEVQGDSMEPTLKTGDRVLIDHTDRNPARPGVYAIWDSNATVVKRVERIPASDPAQLVLISDNKNHNQYTVHAELVNIIGRVVWFGRRL